MTKTMQTLALDDIVIDDEIDFRTDKDGGVEELAASIEAFGLMQPITVADANGDGKYHVVAGRRRLRAFAHLGRTEIDAIVDDELTGERAQVIGQIIENLQREDVGPLDEARAFAKLGDYDMRQKDIAAALGVSSSHVSGRLALLKLPEPIVAKVLRGDVSTALATKIARLPKAVRDELASQPYLDDRSIARIEGEQKEVKERTEVVNALAAAGVPADFSRSGWGYESADVIAGKVGLTDDDKPKTHEWTAIGYENIGHYETGLDGLVEAVVANKAKAAFVTGHGTSIRVMMIGSANLAKDRKKDEEAMRQAAEERHAAAVMRAEAFEKALAPLVASPDKATLISAVLADFLQAQLSGYGNVLGTILDTAERLGLTLTQPDLAGGEGGSQATEVEHYRRQVLAHATKDSTTLVKAIVASQKSVTPLLLQQGWLAQGGTLDGVPVHTQLDYLERGFVTEDDLTGDAAARLAEDRQAEVADAEVEQRIIDEAEAALTAKAIEDGHDPDELDEWPYSEEEVTAVYDQVRVRIESEDLL